MMIMMMYILNILIAVDQLINAILAGNPDETISSRVYYLEKNGKIMGRIFRPIIDFIFRPFSKHHCLDAAAQELRDAGNYSKKNLK